MGPPVPIYLPGFFNRYKYTSYLCTGWALAEISSVLVDTAGSLAAGVGMALIQIHALDK